ncbi:MAG TPA: peptidylprolyl isomerase [Mycobacteriales bacterium]|nr:peptidylprolyl isomerase [Mycobacteriales bacterium]
MRRGAGALSLAVVALVAGCGDGGDGAASSAKGDVACDASAPAAAKEQQYDAAPPAAQKRAYTAVLTTSCGVITLTLAGDKAPKTVGSFVFLGGKGYFDGTFCHRMTKTDGLTVLQCGDPTGSGGGGPGYRFDDENLDGAAYPRGTVAMANAGPGTNGSQFFLVIKDSQLPPSYTPFGTIDEAGLKVLDTILDGGIADGASDGAPTKKVYLEKVTVS